MKGNSRLGDFKKTHHSMLDLKMVVNNEGNTCSFNDQIKEHWIHTLPTWLIVRERLVDFLF